MADPDYGKDHSGNGQALSPHHEEAEAHHKCHRENSTSLCPNRHPLLLHKGFQVLFIELRPQKPVVKLWGGIGKAEYRQQEKWKRGQNGQGDTCLLYTSNPACFTVILYHPFRHFPFAGSFFRSYKVHLCSLPIGTIIFRQSETSKSYNLK